MVSPKKTRIYTALIGDCVRRLGSIGKVDRSTQRLNVMIDVSFVVRQISELLEDGKTVIEDSYKMSFRQENCHVTTEEEEYLDYT